MIKRFRWVFLAVLVGGAILWMVLAGGGQKGESANTLPGENKGRESSRHRTGEVGKYLGTALEKKVAEQEQRVVDRRKELSKLAKARTPILLQPDGAPSSEDSPEETAKKAQAVQDFENAKREYTAEKELLLKLKTELADEQAKAKPRR